MIQLQDVHKSFGKNEVLKGIDLHVTPGEVVVIIGPSGSGKSTVLRCMNYLEVPTSGKVVVDGLDLANKDNLSKVRTELGMVFQRFNLFPHMSVLKNLTLAQEKVRKTDKKEARKIALQLLERVGLADKAEAYPDNLSGGQQQRVAIARAIVNRPAVLIADEPTGNLDPITSRDIVDLFKRINNYGTTVVMITHNMDIVSYLNKRVIALENGRVVSDQLKGAAFNETQNI